MKLYLTKVQDMQSSFKKFYIVKIPREENEKTNHLARIASTEENKKLGDRKGDWAEDILEVLWAYRTMRITLTEETPYALAFGSEAVIPAEVGSGSFRVEIFRLESNDKGLFLHLDLLQEKRDQAQVSMSAYQERVARYFNKKVRHRSFQVGDLVLRKVTIATKDPTEGKFAPSWEGPYRVIDNRRMGAYYLEDSEGKILPRPWNAEHLRKYFV
ncbi:uncharacterized protein LOC132169538 [Corylus avellana]|uniref:uncharacterized protein LOC132169538 n=1 Tax=Corylus avellana TaxID=13451 RepID=UPI00286AF18E|nr:uncharacterized protein LOC132169538 [Corylus avellana]